MIKIYEYTPRSTGRGDEPAYIDWPAGNGNRYWMRLDQMAVERVIEELTGETEHVVQSK